MHTNQWRNRRNQLNLSPIPAFNMYSIANYSTDTSKTDLSKSFAEEMLIHNLHMMPNPLQKNLADTIPTAEKAKPRFTEPKLERKAFPEPKMEKDQTRTEYSFSFGSFFSGVISAISSGVFRRRGPTQQYYDCFDPEPSWQTASEADLNKSTRSQSLKEDAMSADCRSAAAHCEDKLNRVRHLLSSKPVPTTPKYRRKPKRVFVEPGSVEESFEDAFSPEDFVRLSNSNDIECISPLNHHKEEVIEAAALKVKTEVKEVMDIIQTLPEAEIVPVEKIKHNIETKDAKANTQVESQAHVKHNQKTESKATDHIEAKIEVKPDLPYVPVEELREKQEVIAACEDKVNRLKALLQCRTPKSRLTKTESDSVLEPVTDTKNKKVQDKHFKNPARTTDKRKQSQLIKNIQEDMCFGNSLDTEDVSSPDNSPIIPPTKLCDMINLHPKLIPEPEPEYFDEVHGRFRSTSTDSEDSFQIVFTDGPKAARHPTLSDCESEDSFIVFEDSPDSCYTSHDVFGDSTADSDLDSDVSDSGCGVSCKLSHSLTRTVGDLTDDSLFDDTMREESGDEVDSVTVCEELPDLAEEVNTGLLLNEAKKLLRKQEPPKKVSFSDKPPKVHVMRVWSFAARQARRGNWEQDAMDRDRFKRKIADVDMAVSWVLKPQHRRRIMFQRFMPWWNKQRRLEIEERKRKQEEDRIAEEKRIEDEKRLEEARIEEERLKSENDEVKEDVSVVNEVNTESAENGNSVEVKDGVDKDLNKVNGVNENGFMNETVDVKDGKSNLDLKIHNGNVNDLNVDKIAKTLAKCDFYDKSESSKANSILASKVAT